MAHDKGITFKYDKYNKPELLDMKQNVVDIIINTCFMIPGNLPGLPNIGANIRQYFYKPESELSSEKIGADIIQAIGNNIAGTIIHGIEFSIQPTKNTNETIFLLIIKIQFPSEPEQLLGIALKTDAETVTYNFSYTNL